MVAVLGFSLTLLEAVILFASAVGLIIGFLIAVWYWGLDHKTQNYDEGLRSEILSEAAFSGIRTAARTKLVITSDSNISKLGTFIQKILGWIQAKPDKVVVVEGDNFETRQIEVIRERVRDVPGKNILVPDLISGIRNFYAYKLALSSTEIDSNVVEHFKNRFEESGFSGKISELGKSENYARVCLMSNNSEGRDPLNDVFLELVQATEKYCISPITDVDRQIEEIERCREHLMVTLYLLWAQHMKGIRVRSDLSSDNCLAEYRNDAREEDNWGYWMLPDEACGEDEFRRLRHLAWRINDTLEHHWSGVEFSLLYPQGESIREMEFVQTPFLIAHMEEDEFRGGGPASVG